MSDELVATQAEVDEMEAMYAQVCQERDKARAERDALREGMELAWVVIANVSEGRWDEQTAEWVAAAERWRDEHWHVIPLDPEDGERDG